MVFEANARRRDALAVVASGADAACWGSVWFVIESDAGGVFDNVCGCVGNKDGA